MKPRGEPAQRLPHLGRSCSARESSVVVALQCQSEIGQTPLNLPSDNPIRANKLTTPLGGFTRTSGKLGSHLRELVYVTFRYRYARYCDEN